MSHKSTDVRLPETGIVLVTGNNGSGKSSLYEAVAYSFFGKTVRGTNPWIANTPGKTVVEASSIVACRKADKDSKSSFTWKSVDKETTKYATKTKTKKALEQQVGTYDVWKKTHIFSLADIASFTLAPDSERKRFLEALLDLTRFDSALKQCRLDLSAKSKEINELQRQIDIKEALKAKDEDILVEASRKALAGEFRPITEIKEALANLDDLKMLLKTGLETRYTMLQEMNESLAVCSSNCSSLLSRANKAREKLEKVASLTGCPTCQQTVSEQHRFQLESNLKTKIQNLESEYRDAFNYKNKLNKKKEDMLAILKEDRQALASTEEEIGKLSVRKAEVSEYLSRKDSLEKEIESYCAEIADLASQKVTLEKEKGILEHVEKVLGLRGFRSKLLSSLLTGIEELSNKYLADLAGDEQIKLEFLPYKENKSGAVSDCIDIKVSGAGGGYGYKAASAGERRRIDVAILLALADIAGSSESGTLWFDEVMDSLDKQGCEAIIDILGTFAQNRNIVLISHSDELINKLKVSKHIKIENGYIVDAVSE